MTKVAKLAEDQQHHPRWQNEWNKVDIWLSTHDAGNKVTEKDKTLAKEIDKLTKSSSVKAKSAKPEPAAKKRGKAPTDATAVASGGTANPIDDPNAYIKQNFHAMSNRELARAPGLSEHTIRRKLGEWRLRRIPK